MDNFDLRKYLAEGRLLKEDLESEVISRIRNIGKEEGIADEDVEDYVGEFSGFFEPDAYENTTDEELLKDLRLYIANLSENKLINENKLLPAGDEIYKQFEDAGIYFDDGILGGVGSGGGGYYDQESDKISGYYVDKFDEDEFEHWYSSFSTKENLNKNVYPIDKMEKIWNIDSSKLPGVGIYGVEDMGAAEVHEDGSVTLYAYPTLSDEAGDVFINIFSLGSDGSLIPHISKEEVKEKLALNATGKGNWAII